MNKKEGSIAMLIRKTQVNHLTNPIGYRMKRQVFHWVVEDAKGTKEEAARIIVKQGGKIVCDTGFSALSSLAVPLDIDLKPRTRYTWTVTVCTDAGEEAESAEQFFETGKMDEPWEGQWIRSDSQDRDKERHPVFHKHFLAKTGISCARLYISGLGMFDAMSLESILDVVVMDARLRQEVGLFGVLQDDGKQTVERACGAEEHLALAVLDVLLDVKRHGLGGTEILHRLGDVDAHLLTELEKVVDGVARGEDDSGMLGENGHLLSTEFLWGETLYLNELLEVDLHIIFLCNLVVVFFCLGSLRLGNQNALYHSFCCFRTFCFHLIIV